MFKPLSIITTALAVLALAACTPPTPSSASDVTTRCVEVVTKAAAAATDDAADVIAAGAQVDPADVQRLVEQLRRASDLCASKAGA